MWRDKRTGTWQTKIGCRQVSLRTKNSHIAAQREAKLKVDFGNAIFGLRKPSRIIFYDLAQQYLKSLEATQANRKGFKSKLLRIRRRLEKHVYPEFSNDAVMMITASRVCQWAERLLMTHAQDGVNRIVTIMRAIVKWGVRHDTLGLPYDPVNHWPRFKAPQDKWTTLTEGEVGVILDSDDREFQKILPIVTVALFTGLRLANVVLLKWSQVDLTHGFIRIEGAETKGRDVVTIPILPRVEMILRQASGKHPLFVFVKPDGEPWTPNSVSRLWRQSKSRLGIVRKVRFHDLRHTFASHLAMMQGKPLTVVGEILGHKSPTMTKRYSHLTPEYLTPEYLKHSLEGFDFCQPNVSGKKHNQEIQENAEKIEE